MKLRRLNEKGLVSFDAYLDELRTDPRVHPPYDLLDNEGTSCSAADIEVVVQKFSTRMEAGGYLHSLIESAGLVDAERDQGLWAWLSLCFFDTVCPRDNSGQRKAGARARYVPDVANFQRYYRHLLAGPWRIYRSCREDPEAALVILCQPVDSPGDIVEQIASRQELVTNRAFLAAATKLFINPESHTPKTGASSKARRAAAFCDQFEVTWDLYTMTADDIYNKFPKEFDRFTK